MAVAFVNSVNTTSAAAFTMDVTLPTHSEGEVIVLSFVHDYNSSAQILTSVSEGYTELVELSISGLAHQGAVWYKIAGASEVNPTATYSLDSQEMACQASSYSGVDEVTPIDTGASLWNTEDPGDTTVDSPSITTATDGAMFVSVATADENDTFTQPSGMSLVGNLVFSNMVIASAYETIATAGATGVRAWVFAQNTDEITAVSFALRPASGGGGISGTITQTAQSFTQSLIGTNILNIDGSITQSLNSFTQSANGTVVAVGFTGTINQTISSFTQLANGIVTTNLTGTITQTTGAFTQLASGAVIEDITGVIAQTVSSFTQSATGVVPLNIPESDGLLGNQSLGNGISGNQSTGNGVVVTARLGAGVTGSGSL